MIVKRLDNLRVYLAGPMDDCNNRGVDWRRSITPHLKKFGLKIFDPTNKPTLRGEEMECWELRQKYKAEGNWDELSKIMREVSNVDLRMVDLSDFIIAHLDRNIYINGTIHEIVMANSQKKPVLLHMEQGKEQVADWWFGRLDHNEFFSTWDELITYLGRVNNDPHFKPGKRWYFFDKELFE